MTTIRYFIPEDGDSEAQPNVFLAPKPRQQGYPPSLGQVKNAFPLPGRYHFRFKSPLVPGTDREKHAMPVWMDCVDDRQPVPVWRNHIVAKVTRIGVEEDEDEDDDDEDFHRPNGTANPAPTPAPPQAAPAPRQAPPQHQPSLDLFDNGHSTPPAAPAAATANHSHHSSDLLGGMHSSTTTSTHSNSFGAGSGDLLGMSTPSPPVSGNHPATYGQTPGGYHPGGQQQPQSGPFF